MQDELDDEALLRSVLRPARARLAEARAAIAEITDPQEAWETLGARGILPADWCESDDRRFQAGPPVLEEPIGMVRSDYEAGAQVLVWRLDEAARYRLSSRGGLLRDLRAAEPLRAGDFVVRCGRFDVRPAERPPWSAFPPSLDAVLAFASDVTHAAAAETLAREHFGDSSYVIHWRAVGDDELVGIREDALGIARSKATPRELRAVLELGYFVSGLDDQGAIELLCPESVDEP